MPLVKVRYEDRVATLKADGSVADLHATVQKKFALTQSPLHSYLLFDADGNLLDMDDSASTLLDPLEVRTVLRGVLKVRCDLRYGGTEAEIEGMQTDMRVVAIKYDEASTTVGEAKQLVLKKLGNAVALPDEYGLYDLALNDWLDKSELIGDTASLGSPVVMKRKVSLVAFNDQLDASSPNRRARVALPPLATVRAACAKIAKLRGVDEEEAQKYGLFLPMNGEITGMLLDYERAIASYRLGAKETVFYRVVPPDLRQKLDNRLVVAIDSPAHGVVTTMRFFADATLSDVVEEILKCNPLPDDRKNRYGLSTESGDWLGSGNQTLSEAGVSNRHKLFFEEKGTKRSRGATAKSSSPSGGGGGGGGAMRGSGGGGGGGGGAVQFSAEAVQNVRDEDGYMVPQALATLKSSLVRQGGLEEQGVFRMAGGEAALTEAKRMLNARQFNKIDSINGWTAHCAASLLKRWLGEMPERLLDGVSLEDMEKAAQSEEDAMEFALTGLPPVRMHLLWWLVDLLASVAKHKEKNLMTTANLAIVVAPQITDVSTVHDPFRAIPMTQAAAALLESLIRTRLSGQGPTAEDTMPSDDLLREAAQAAESKRIDDTRDSGVDSNGSGGGGGGADEEKVSRLTSPRKLSNTLKRKKAQVTKALAKKKAGVSASMSNFAKTDRGQKLAKYLPKSKRGGAAAKKKGGGGSGSGGGSSRLGAGDRKESMAEVSALEPIEGPVVGRDGQTSLLDDMPEVTSPRLEHTTLSRPKKAGTRRGAPSRRGAGAGARKKAESGGGGGSASASASATAVEEDPFDSLLEAVDEAEKPKLGGGGSAASRTNATSKSSLDDAFGDDFFADLDRATAGASNSSKGGGAAAAGGADGDLDRLSNASDFFGDLMGDLDNLMGDMEGGSARASADAPIKAAPTSVAATSAPGAGSASPGRGGRARGRAAAQRSRGRGRGGGARATPKVPSPAKQAPTKQAPKKPSPGGAGGRVQANASVAAAIARGGAPGAARAAPSRGARGRGAARGAARGARGAARGGGGGGRARGRGRGAAGGGGAAATRVAESSMNFPDLDELNFDDSALLDDFGDLGLDDLDFGGDGGADDDEGLQPCWQCGAPALKFCAECGAKAK